MKLIKEGKVTTHTQSYKGRKIKSPRITITGKKLQQAGFDIGDKISVRQIGEGAIIIENKD